ncbi:MAG: PIN domain-containing protein [Bacteroidota bacterium]|nr:PIN domain-containing protein [Bacteroidota bacterium]
MNVFVESNFLLEIAFQQEHHAACERILAGAAAGRYQLHVPQYALTEVFQTLHRRTTEREDYQQYFLKQIDQHQREAEFDAAEVDQLVRLLNDLLTTRTASQANRLFSLTQRLAAEAPGPPLTAAVLMEAPALQATHGLGVQDALVYASVLAGLRVLPRGPKLFITRNDNDFRKPAIVEELRKFDCKLLANFRGAADMLDSGKVLPANPAE